MSPPTCPSCKATLPAQEVIDGWCDACGKQLPPALRAPAPSPAPPPEVPAPDLEADDEGPAGQAPGLDLIGLAFDQANEGRCDLCEQRRKCLPCFLKVAAPPGRVLSGWVFRWINVRSVCCSDCHQKVRGLETLSGIGKWVMLGTLPLLCVPGVLLGLLIDWLFGLEAEPATKALFLGTVVLGILAFILTPYFLLAAYSRRVKRLLTPQLERRLLEVAQAGYWAAGSLTVRFSLPPGETSVDIDQI